MHDALQAAAQLAALVEGSGGRRVLRIGAAGACGDAATVYLPGCNLRCVHCWAGPDRDNPEAAAPLWSYALLRQRLDRFRRENRLAAATSRTRLSGGEPILGERFFDLLEALLGLPGQILVETNGTLLGVNPDWAVRLARLSPRVAVKLSLKAGTAEQFERLTGARREAWESSWEAVRALHAARARFDLNALTHSRAIFSAEEHAALRRRLAAVDPSLLDLLEEEPLTGYPGTLRRMNAASRVTL